MPAIQAKYLSPTNHRGARIKLTAPDHKSKTLPRDYSSADGIDLEEVRVYVRECYPHADLSKVSGPYYLSDRLDVYVF
jgi:hypothetical protein